MGGTPNLIPYLDRPIDESLRIFEVVFEHPHVDSTVLRCFSEVVTSDLFTQLQCHRGEILR